MQLKDTKAAAMELLSELPIKKPRKLKRSDISLIVLSFICALFLTLQILLFCGWINYYWIA